MNDADMEASLFQGQTKNLQTKFADMNYLFHDSEIDFPISQIHSISECNDDVICIQVPIEQFLFCSVQ